MNMFVKDFCCNFFKCPKSCGFHEQYRHAHCIRGERIVNDEECFEAKPETDRRRCKIPTECSFKYRRGIWSQVILLNS